MKGWTFISPEGTRWFVAEARSANEAMDAIHMATVMGSLGTTERRVTTQGESRTVITSPMCTALTKRATRCSRNEPSTHIQEAQLPGAYRVRGVER
jgi:hypothetical protein